MSKPKEMTAAIGLIAMFLLGYVSSNMVDTLSDCDTCSKMEQRMERALSPRMNMRKDNNNKNRENQESRYDRRNHQSN